MFTIPSKPRAYNTQAPSLSALGSLLSSLKGLQQNVTDISESAGDYVARGRAENGDVNLEDSSVLNKLRGLSLSKDLRRDIETQQQDKRKRVAVDTQFQNVLERDGIQNEYKVGLENLDHSHKIGEIGARGAQSMRQIGARAANSRSLALLRDSLSTKRMKLSSALRGKLTDKRHSSRISSAISGATKSNVSDTDYSKIMSEQISVANKIKRNQRIPGLTMNETIQVGEELSQARLQAELRRLGKSTARSNYRKNPVKQAVKRRDKWQDKILAKNI